MSASLLLSAAALMQVASLAVPGTYSNEEDRYFAEEADAKRVPDWQGVEISPDQQWRHVDAFGAPLGEWQNGLPDTAKANSDGRIELVLPSGLTTELRLARAFTCWVSLRRKEDRSDGSADWSFASGLAMHDQGGRVTVTDAGADPVQLRMRNVIWPAPSTNKPSLVLYIHHPDEPDRAVSYAWTDPDARILGINLRWMQGSCTKNPPAE